jgi:hypothetical protein
MVVKSNGSWFCAAAGTASAAVRIMAAIGRQTSNLLMVFIRAPYVECPFGLIDPVARPNPVHLEKWREAPLLGIASSRED